MLVRIRRRLAAITWIVLSLSLVLLMVLALLVVLVLLVDVVVAITHALLDHLSQRVMVQECDRHIDDQR